MTWSDDPSDDTPNADTAAARRFHARTKYVWAPQGATLPIAMGTSPDLGDPLWEKDATLEPYPFKVYETLPPVSLPRPETPHAPRVSGLRAIAHTGREPSRAAGPDRSTLARIGLHTNGLLNRGVPGRDQGTHQFRTAGGTGARYHLELYFVCAELPDLDAGIYHYDAREHCLRQLRSGDFRAALTEACGDEPTVAQAPVVLAMTSTFWRNAWRYKARAYRHTYWDAGTCLSHVLTVSAAAGLPARVVLGYADEPVNTLLGVDGAREATVALCTIGDGGAAMPATPTVDALDLPTRPISPAEVTFPDIPAMHAASTLTSGAEAARWRANPLHRRPAEPSGPVTRLATYDDTTLDDIDPRAAEGLIFRRRSTRHYDENTPTSFAAFSALLQLSTVGFAADCLDLGAPPLHDCYLIVNQVEGLAPGIYLHHPRLNAVELIREGDFRADAQRLAIGQQYPGHAHVNCYYLTNLDPVLARYGNRGYRLAQLECSLYAGKLHLATHSFGCGAVGSTSLDDEVVDFFSPHAADSSYMFVTVFGKRRPRAH